MKTMLVYDSVHGNTRAIAEAIASAIPGDVALQPAPEARVADVAQVDLLIVGAPTHGGRPTEAVQVFLDAIPPGTLRGIHVAAFDTRMAWPWLRVIGFAAPRIARSLKKSGGKVAARAEGFFVTGGEGPLREGEIHRAGEWGKALALKQHAVTLERVG